MKYTFVIYVVLFLSLFGCNNRNNQERAKTQPIEEQQETLFIDYYGNGKVRIEGKMLDGHKNGVWRGYKQNGDLQKVEYYYMDSLVHILDPLDFVLVSTVLTDGSTILLPKDWNIKKNYKEALVLAVKPKVFEPETFNPTINIVKISITDSISLKQIVDLNIEEINKEVKELKIKEKESINRLTLPTIQVLYFIDTGIQKLGVSSAYIKDKTALYIITCIAQGDQLQFIKYKDLFNDIIFSFTTFKE